MRTVWKRLAQRAATCGGDPVGPDKMDLVADLGQGLGWEKSKTEVAAFEMLDWECLGRHLGVPEPRLRTLEPELVETLLQVRDRRAAG